MALASLLIVGVVTYRSTVKLIEDAEWVEHTYEVLGKLELVFGCVKDVETSQRGFTLTGEARYLDPYHAALPQIDDRLKSLRELMVSQNMQRRLTTFEALVREKLSITEETIMLRREKGLEAALQNVLGGRGKSTMDQIRTVFNDMVQEENMLLQRRRAQSNRSARQALAVLFCGVPLACVAVGLVGFRLSRGIVHPLRATAAVAERMASGDLSADVPADSRRDEIGTLLRAFAQMTQFQRGMAGVAERIAAGDLCVQIAPQSERDVLGHGFARMADNLRRLTLELAEAMSVLSSTVSEIVASAGQLAAGAAETSTAVSETTTTVEEVRQTARLSSEKARAVADSAQLVVQVSEDGRKASETTIEGMHRIRSQMGSIADSMMRLSEQSQAVGQIISTVDEIAGQSNLLAVNASIEASKAGEHGRGFGVVAQEIKNLAEQSRQATRQVRAILNDIQKATSTAVMVTEQGTRAVEAGVSQSAKAGDSIRALAGNVVEATQSASQIAASSGQQLAGVEQVASAMESVKAACVQNLNSARNLETAAKKLNELGHKLKDLVARYKV